MRKKIVFGTIAFLALAAVAGERYFNRAVGQDIPLPKAPEPEKKDLFDLLKKDLEAKKEAPTFPALPASKKEEPTAPPTLPALPTGKDDKVLIAPPSPPVGDAPKPTIPPVSDKKADVKKADPVLPKIAPDVPTVTPTDEKRKPDQTPAFPPLESNSPKPSTTSGVLTPDLPPPVVLPTSGKQESAPPKSSLFPNQPVPIPTTSPKAVALPKNSPWTLSVVMVDGQTIVTAIVNKKHEFKILCQTLDLQTGKGTLKAMGKVQINGDAFNGTCESLSIALMEDRLLLEGKALVSIDRTSANVSDTTPASFELKGDTLNLRISELQPALTTVTGQPVSRNDAPTGPPSRVITASMKLDGTQWTPFGQLRTVKSNGNMWSLVGSDGAVIAYLRAREGGSLERYVGQSISVYGTRESEHAGQPLLRVTHIAVQ